MKECLDADEKAEADDGYIGEPTKILAPKTNTRTIPDKNLRQRVRNRHETINKRLKDWKCLAVVCRHSLRQHATMFRAVATICQVSINSGEKLFPVDYNDLYFSMAP